MTRRGDAELEGSSVQSLVDALSVALARPVLLDDSALVPLAFSRQWDVDDVRSESILGRGVQPQVRAALLSQGIATARDVVHTSADPELGMSERVCLPVRHGGEVLGYLWLLDPEADLTDEDLAGLRKASREIAAQLAATPGRTVPDEAELLAELRSPEPDVRDRAAAAAHARGLLLEDRVVFCLLAPGASGEDQEDVLTAAQRIVRRLSVGHSLSATVPEGAALVASLGDPVLRMLAPDEVAAWVRAATGSGVIVGQSAATTITTLDEGSRQAAIALRVARAQPEGGFGSWAQLGANRLIAQMPASARTDIPESLLHFLRSEPSLAETLAVFLDMAGEVKSSAEALSLHRSGLYYRLHRIEDLTGLELSRGDDRLLAHLAVRLHRQATAVLA